MKILAVDDERHALELLEQAISTAVPDSIVQCVRTSSDAIEYARRNEVDVAFLDIRIDEKNGLQVAKQLKEIRKETNVIFVTGYSEYMGEALQMHVSGYVEKPVTSEDVATELENLRHPVQRTEKGVRIQCFGNFEVFVNDKPVEFRRAKSKEILAYLVDRRGAGVRNKELAAILWEDSAYTRTVQSYLQTLLVEMMRALNEAGAADIIIKQYNSYAIDTTKVNCDFYRFNAWDAEAVNSYYGEYMANYSWGEATLGVLAKD